MYNSADTWKWMLKPIFINFSLDTQPMYCDGKGILKVVHNFVQTWKNKLHLIHKQAKWLINESDKLV
jgi:hypothetical protein